MNLCQSIVKTEGQSTLVEEIRCSLATLIASLGAVLQSLHKPLAIKSFLLTKLSEATLSIRVSTLADNPIKDTVALKRIRASASLVFLPS